MLIWSLRGIQFRNQPVIAIFYLNFKSYNALAKRMLVLSLTIQCLTVTVVKRWKYLPIALTMLKVATVRVSNVDFRML